MIPDVAMEISGVVACDCASGGGGHVAGPRRLGRQFYLWSCKEVGVFYIVEIGIAI